MKNTSDSGITISDTMFITLVMDIKLRQTNLVDVAWTNFIFLTSPAWYGIHALTLYSRIGRMYSLKRLTKKHGSLELKVLMIRYKGYDKVDKFSKDFGNTTVPFKIRCQSNAKVYEYRYSFKNKFIDVVLVAEVGSWFTGESNNFRLCWLGSKLN